MQSEGLRGYLACSALTVLLLLIAAVNCVAADRPGTLLSGTLTVKNVSAIITAADQWKPFPTVGDRKAWESIRPEVRKAHIKAAEALLHCDWVTPKATSFLEYVRTGNRSNYQSISYGRREQLATLVIGECMEGKGRFLDDITNGIWTICEETYWGVPAHVGAQKKGAGLPDVKEPTVDLFSAETGSLLAWTWYLLHDSLDVISPLVSERIDYEVQRRIIQPNLERNDFWWMGFTRSVNNWNPWICSNWLAAVLVLERDPGRRAESVHKILRCLDNFLKDYPDDGGCDEGPSYWSRAGGSLFDCLELLKSASRGQIDVFGNPLIREIGRYITRVHIHDDYFVNFADAAAKTRADASTIYRYGRAIDDSTMMKFGSFVAHRRGLGNDVYPGQWGVLGRALPGLFALDDLLQTPPAEPLLKDSWMPGVQVMTARSEAGSVRGFYLAAQGGHNAESHNHNDVGNFVVFADGNPVLIDVGVETYTAKTFSKDRYSIWTMQSAYHNLPTINGVTQKDGRDFAASDLRYAFSDGAASLTMNIASAYPESAAVRTWLRHITLHRGKDVTIRDEYDLKESRRPLQWSLMTCLSPEVQADGTVKLRTQIPGPAEKPVFLELPASVNVQVEPIDLKDEQLRSSWGDKIYRIMVTSKDIRKKGTLTVTVHQ
jgi:hypothetical protein